MSFRGSRKAQQNKMVEALANAKQALMLCLAENERLNQQVEILERRLSDNRDAQILLLNRAIRLEEELEEVTRRNADRQDA